MYTFYFVDFEGHYLIEVLADEYTEAYDFLDEYYPTGAWYYTEQPVAYYDWPTKTFEA